MKSYLAVTTVLFGLLAVIHLWRAIATPASHDPWFLVIAVLAACLCLWSCRLYLAARSAGTKSP